MERSPFTPSRSPRSPGQIPFSTPNWLSSPSTLTSFERSKIFSLQENESLTLMELGTAARIIDDQCIIDDRNVPELGSAHMEYSSIPTTQQHPTFFLSQNESLELPEAILEQYNNMQYKCFMGIFSEIGRAWITIDNQLFLWNIEGNEFNVYDGLNQVIISVAIAPVKPNVFLPEIRYVLVVCTPVEVVLLALTLSPTSELNIHPTGLSTSSDNVSMAEVVGTLDGRILMGGKDGNIYELFYQAEDDWLESKCRLVNHSANIFSKFIPSFLNLFPAAPIIRLVVDNTRKILYCLTENSCINIYDIADNQVKCSQTLNNPQNELPSPFNRNLKIVNIFSVTLSESSRVQLMAVTNTGLRLFFTSSVGDLSRPLTLQHLVDSPREPPFNFIRRSITSPGHQPFNQQEIGVTFYHHNVFLLAKPLPEADSIITVSTDLRSNFRSGPRDRILESVSEIPLADARVFCITEESEFRNAPPWFLLPFHVVRNELATQHLVPKRKFFCLTNAGLRVLIKNRPVDELYEILSQSDGRDPPELRDFFEKYGEEQSCAMCLMIASGNYGSNFNFTLSSSRLLSQFVPNINIIRWAVRAFFKYGGHPQILRSLPYHSGTTPISDFSSPHPVQYSSSHNGFALYLSRLIRPVWNENVTVRRKERKNNEREVDVQYCKFLPEQLNVIQEMLSNLYKFIHETPALTSSISPSSHLDNGARQGEQNSFKCMVTLLDRASQASAFLAVLSGNHFSLIAERLTQEQQLQLSQMKFRDFVLKPDSVNLSKELVNGLIEVLTIFNMPIEPVIDTLTKTSPKYFSHKDQFKLLGFQFLQFAKQTQNAIEQADLLDLATEKFSQSIEYIPQLIMVCSEFQKLKYYKGIIQLALNFAKNVDPSDEALAWKKSGSPENDPRRELYDKRLTAYNCIADTFNTLFWSTTGSLTPQEMEKLRQDKKTVVQLSIASQDELFHYFLYEWYLDKDLGTELLQINSPFLENFLKDSNQYKLLSNYYIRHGKMVPAAIILIKFAESKDPNVTLLQRIEYLGTANNYLTDEHITADRELVQQLQEKIDVAKIQLTIQNELRQIQSPKTQEAVRFLDTELYNLSDLYNLFAKKFSLWESQLTILHCSGYNDPVLVRNLWTNIIHKESQSGKIAPLENKILELGQKFFPSDLVFPLGFLVDALEHRNYEFGTQDNLWVLRVFTEIGVTFPQLFDIYASLEDSSWTDPKQQHHLGMVIYSLIEGWFNFVNSSKATPFDKKQFQMKQVHSLIKKWIPQLQANNYSNELVQKFKILENRIPI